MPSSLPKPNKQGIFYEDEKVYACLASQPIAKAHVVVVWKKKITDLRLLSDRDYDYLMDTVNAVRNSMIKTLGISKVYLIYMDEAKHVHWQLVPRYNEKGYNIFSHQPKPIKDFSLAKVMKKNLKF